jgi:peptidyl-dipeptidase Dcp
MKTALHVTILALFMLAACARKGDDPQQPQKEDAVVETNPLLADWNTPFGVPPFGEIENKHFVPAIKTAIAQHQAEIDSIAKSPDSATFENTVEALDRSGEKLSRIRHVFYGLLGANTNDELNEIAKQISPLLSKHQDNILLNEVLFARLGAVRVQKSVQALSTEQKTLLEEFYQDFVRGGANLDDSDKAKLRQINETLSVLTLQFGQNILKEDNEYKLVIEDEADLAGLPNRVIEGGAKAAAEQELEGKWVFTLHKPSLLPFLTHSEKRDLREKMFKAYIARGANANLLDNREIIKQIIDLRTRKAQLLGFGTHADFALARRMAGNPKNVYDLLGKLWKPALTVAQKEAGDLQQLIDEEGGGFKLEAWDWWYYAEKVRKARFDLDDGELRPYFSLENVQNGAFEVATRLYGLTFHQRTDLPVYHPDVKTYEVKDKDGTHLGIFYTDFFPRSSKRGGAWCGAFREASKLGHRKVAPIVTNVGNFSMPTGDKPALLSFEEANTLFHEFGHALHSLLNDTTYHRTRDAVQVDFVELPSQIMENWAAEPEVLRMYARHYKTGEPIPDALIAKIEKSATFNQGFETVEYLAASFLDMDWHTAHHGLAMDVDKFEQESLQKIGLLPEVVSRYQSNNFRHIFSGSYYAAGYYSYIWAAVLDADAFEAFKENGLFDQKTAAAFREHVLSKGGSEDQMDLYRRFRGKEPDIQPLLKRRGLLLERK